MKNKKIKKIPALLILLALSKIEQKLIPLIEVKEIEEGLVLLIGPTKEVVQVLSDKDPNDKEQLKEVWNDFLQSKDLSLYEETNLNRLVGKIKDDTLKDGLTLAVKPIVNIRRALTDDVNPNSEQIKKILSEFIEDESVVNFIIEDLLEILLKKYIKNDDTVEFIIEIIKESKELVLSMENKAA